MGKEGNGNTIVKLPLEVFRWLDWAFLLAVLRRSAMRLSNPLFGIIGLLVLLGTGCAPHVVVAIPEKRMANPTSGPTVVITRVTDHRRFAQEPTVPSVPSLKQGAISDIALTSRAFGRLATAWDFLLPEGRTIAMVVRENLTHALREAGYRVTEDGPSAPQDALKLEVDIVRYWCWFEPGFWFCTLNFKGALDLKGDVFRSGDKESLDIQIDKGYQVVVDQDWGLFLVVGGETLSEKFKEKLKAPR
jgi:hypothetical protein